MKQPNYSKQLLWQLNQQRARGYLCDVIIVVGNALFRAHKNILAACSSYFNSPLLRDNVITLDAHMIKAPVFRQVLDFIYTGQLPSSHHASDRGVSALLRAASYLQLTDLAAICRRKLEPRRPNNPPLSSTTTTSSSTKPGVTHSSHLVSMEDRRSHDEQIRLEETIRCASSELVEARLTGESPSSSILQQSPPNSSSNCASSDDNTEQWYPTLTADSQLIAAQEMNRSSREGREEVESGGPELEDHAEVLEEDLALKNELEQSVETGSEVKELNGNTQASYVFHQPQPAFTLQGSVYMCIPCGEGFPSSEHLIAHVESHMAQQLRAEDAEKERILIKVDVGDPNTRPSCQSYVDAAALLRQHERNHKPFSCSLCGKMFTQRGTMTRHMRSHLGLKPFACDQCGMRFTRQYRKMEHMRIHTR